MNRFLVSFIFFIYLFPVVLQANTISRSAMIDKIVQEQKQWKQEWNKKVPTNRASTGDFYSPKIVGGSTAVRGQHREFALVFFTNAFGDILTYCGGTLIDSNKVLTAAHCTEGFSTLYTFVIPDFYSFNDNLVNSDIFTVSKKHIHPGYSSNRFDYDVSVLTLDIKSNTPTAKLFGGENLLVNFPATIIGVGTLSEGGTAPDDLQTASIPVVSNAVCRDSYGAVITERMMCAGLIGGGRDSCQGDSGGPLWINFDGQKVQAGITSFGQGCARPNFYGVYSRISSLTTFIQQHAPDTEFILEAKPNIIPFLQLLLLDEFIPPVCNLPVDIGDTFNVRFADYCYDFDRIRYYKTFTFTIDQAREISITANSVKSFLGNIRLFSGTDRSGAELSSDNISQNTANLVDRLDAGTYTLEVTNRNPDGNINVNLSENNCESSPISINSIEQVSFTFGCRSLTLHDNPFAAYFTFTLPQDQQVMITTPNSNDIDDNTRLFAGTDVSVDPIDSDDNYFSAAVLLNQLAAGTYTIEVTRSKVNALVDLDLRLNQCNSPSIDIGTTVQNTFTSDCRSMVVRDHPYASYYSFMVIQRQDISISATVPGNAHNFDVDSLHLFSGANVSAPSISSDRFGNNKATILKTLDPGIYTVEVTNDDVTDLIDLNVTVNDCSSTPISINSSVQASFSTDCRSFNNSDYVFARYYSFTLAQDEEVIITSPISGDSNSDIRLFAGTNVTGTHLDNGSTYSGEAVLLNKLTAGTYTIELTHSNVNALVDLDVTLNRCNSMSINPGDTIQATFASDCRSMVEYDHSYASYYTFTLSQTRPINLVATTLGYGTKTLNLFSGTNVSSSPVMTDRFFDRQAKLMMTLDPGTYTIELTSSYIDHIIDLSVLESNCPALPVGLNTTVQASFSKDCLSIFGNRKPYARHFTFTLSQSREVSITAASNSDSDAYIRLFNGNDVTAIPIDTDDTYYNNAEMVNQLSVGTYTIEFTSSDVTVTKGLTITSGI